MSVPVCSSRNGAECAPAECHGRCAVEVIDDLLGQPGAVSGGEADMLLDLRWKLGRREDAENALRLFCDLRLRMEQRHYLAFFRIRRWLANHLLAAVRVSPIAEAVEVPVRLNHYCVEAIRRICLCAVLGNGLPLFAPRLRFAFRSPALLAPAAALAGERGV